MRPWIRNSLIGLAVLLIIAGIAYYWLVVDGRMQDAPTFALDMTEIRRAANAMPGEKASRIEVENVALYKFPATAVVAGDGWRLVDLPVFSYRVAFPDTSIVIDTALTAELGGNEIASFDAAAFERMQAAMTAASAIVVTHEHLDHIGGLTGHRDLRTLLPATRLTKEQLSEPTRSEPPLFPPGVLDQYEPLTYDRLHALAPGIVLIKAAGHTPGSQMVFVQLADGSEFLFIGDVAWHARNIDAQRERARLVTWLMLKEDRAAVFAQLTALKKLSAAEPSIYIVPGHDGEVIGKLVQAGSLKQGFAAASK